MSYKTLPYTYGAKSLDDINALTDMVEGETVYNLDWNIIEVFDGAMWVNDQCTKRNIVSGEVGAIPLGYLVKQNSSGEIQKLTGDDTSNWQDYLGLVVRIKSGVALVAHMGRYQALINYEDDSTIANGVGIRPSEEGGLVRETSSYTSSGARGIIGYTVEAVTVTQTSNYLCWVTLQTIEMA